MRGPVFTNNYNALQASLNHHSHGLQVGLAYTWSKDMTTQSTDRGSLSTYQYDFKMDYGPASYNQPQTFTASYVYDLPWYKGQQGFVGKIAGGWEVFWRPNSWPRLCWPALGASSWASWRQAVSPSACSGAPGTSARPGAASPPPRPWRCWWWAHPC